ncbi:PH domain-containing protein [Georgenia sp. 10Sc9-8]|uniref:PH domain-containing protein n=1 Tax=Georgenia halotolerans TaxID=3028317 RepID=A0ABT5TUY9_9MICO|nr:PH domain-containing protein [Georgenia halotolerans]
MSSREELERPIRPRYARIVGLVLGVLTVLGAVAIMVLVPLVAGVPLGPVDYLGTTALALLICWFLYRQASVAAVPDDDGLTVRNLFLTRTVTWPEIVSVRFGQDRPWGYLDLAEGEELAVMALQQADGAYGRTEARRLATLVALHEPGRH